jgi:glyoxylase-like metal-dependent hydrolase (beta-lactamase superfamily II)
VTRSTFWVRTASLFGRFWTAYVPAEAWAPFRQRYPALFSGPDTWHNHYGCYLLRSQGRTILVDTGIGSKTTNPGMVNTLAGGIDGRLLAELQAAGVRPEEVDAVFFTHLHPDHVGWNLSQSGANPRPTFPRARYVVHQTDWATFKQPEVQGRDTLSLLGGNAGAA